MIKCIENPAHSATYFAPLHTPQKNTPATQNKSYFDSCDIFPESEVRLGFLKVLQQAENVDDANEKYKRLRDDIHAQNVEELDTYNRLVDALNRTFKQVLLTSDLPQGAEIYTRPPGQNAEIIWREVHNVRGGKLIITFCEDGIMRAQIIRGGIYGKTNAELGRYNIYEEEDDTDLIAPKSLGVTAPQSTVNESTGKVTSIATE